MKPSSIVLILFTAWIVQACSSSEGKNEVINTNTEKIPVVITALEKQQVKPVISTSGIFTTDDETYLAFKVGGVISRIYVKEGDAIRKGQLLASLDLVEIEAQVAQAKLAYEKSVRDFGRVENLYKDSVATLEQYQNAKTGMEVAARQYDAAKFNRSYSEIRAVSNGYVLRKLANEGQVVSPGSSVLQTNGASQNSWKLRVGVSDREWAIISIGDAATVTTDALPGVTLAAKVTRKAEGTDGTGSFSVELTLEKTKAALASGLFGKTTIQVSQAQTRWSIPYEALLDGNAQSGYVFTTNDSQIAHKTPVVVSGINRDQVLISAGLEDAKFLIISGSAYLRDSSAITLIQ
ncbi:MAG TPA: efflux RND transporter periplasmic adaptor subunit [Cyclobacteriaceae bacterium]|nr:efflux RND transporter periplasmic adaptor subunit [Cyclobacteriaceae bacterium]